MSNTNHNGEHTMTITQQTVNAFEAGNHAAAFALFKTDPDAMQDIEYKAFCKGMENCIRRRNEAETSEAAHAEAMAN